MRLVSPLIMSVWLEFTAWEITRCYRGYLEEICRI